MPLNTRDLIEAISIVADNNNIRVTIKSSLKASCTTAVTTFAGGMLFGPLGIPFGATIGGLLAFARTEKFKSVGSIIRDELSAEQKRKLCQHIIDAFKSVRSDEIATLICMITQPGQIQATVIKKIVQFFIEEMHMNVIN
ncbi:hypothetical protein ACKWTF_008489 [Chironomus riparius]